MTSSRGIQIEKGARGTVLGSKVLQHCVQTSRERGGRRAARATFTAEVILERDVVWGCQMERRKAL